ncbi:EAL domain-containing protein, partial [bacterium]|nr:EAL domain-containing protein [bacterium]
MIFQQPEETNDNILSLHFQRKFPAQEPQERLEINLKGLLYNEVTALPTLPVMFETIQQILNKQGQMGFLYINIVQYSMLEQIYGWRKFDFFMKELAASLVEIKRDFLRKNDAICEVMIKGSSFLLILSPSRTKRLMDRKDLEKICKRIGTEFNSALKRRLGDEIFQKLGCYFGYSILEDDTTQRIERLVYTAVDRAHESSLGQKQQDVKRRSAALNTIVVKKKIYTVYQPILDFQDKKVIGYEALNRGPKGEFENPDLLFRLAYENNVVWALDRLCRIQALRGFINREPSDYI